MIRTFKTKKLLFSPVGFLNSVAKWLLGVNSPTGTIRIRNTANPSEDGGPSIDIDSHEVARAIDPYIRASYPKVGVKKLLGASMKWENGQLEVDDNWLKARVIDNDSVDPSVGADMPQDVSGEADKGTLDKCARADHVHKLDTDSSLSFTNGKLGVNFGTAEGTAAEGNHDHDGEYAEVDHTHDEYAATDHTHSEYAATNHTHSGYAATNHTHSGYAATNHTHSEYAATNHTHSGYAAAGHTHSEYQTKSSKLDGISVNTSIGNDGSHCITSSVHYSGLQGNHSQAFLGCSQNSNVLGMLSWIDPNIVGVEGSSLGASGARLSSWIKSGTANVNGSKVQFSNTSGSTKVAEISTAGTISASSSTYSKFSSTPSGSKLVQTSGTSGNLAEVTIGNGLKLENSTLSPKFKSSGGLSSDSDGLKLDSVGTASKTLQLITVENETSTNIVLSFYGLEIDANGRVIGRTANPYKRIDVSPGF